MNNNKQENEKLKNKIIEIYSRIGYLEYSARYKQNEIEKRNKIIDNSQIVKELKTSPETKIIFSKIVNAYHDILKKEPDVVSFVKFLNAILNEQKSFEWFVNELRNSPEGIISAKITDLYLKILKREPDFAGMKHWKNLIIIEGKSYDWLKNQLKNSEEAKSTSNSN